MSSSQLSSMKEVGSSATTAATIPSTVSQQHQRPGTSQNYEQGRAAQYSFTPSQQQQASYYSFNTGPNYPYQQQPDSQPQQHGDRGVYQGVMPSSSDYNSLTSLPPIGSARIGQPVAPGSSNPVATQQNNNSNVMMQLRSLSNDSKFSTTFWEDENTICYQVEARGVPVSRREDSDFVNGTKLLNVVGMTRGRRDGILKSEKTRYVVKIGAMNLKGVWIPFDRAVELATSEGVLDLLYPLFVRDIKSYYQENLLNHPVSSDSPFEKTTKPRKKRTTKKKQDEEEPDQQYLQPAHVQGYTPYQLLVNQYNSYYLPDQQQQLQQQQQQQQQLQLQQTQSQPPYTGYYSSYGQQPQQQQQQQQFQTQSQQSQQQQSLQSPQGQQYNSQYPQAQQIPQQQYTPYQSLLPQQQEYVQQYYNYYRQFQPQQPSYQQQPQQQPHQQ